LHEVIAHGPDAFGEVRGPGKTRGAGGLWLEFFHLDAEARLGGGGLLKIGAEPADETGAFLGGARGVELDEAKEDLFGWKVLGPTVGFGDGAIQIVVEVPKNRNQTVVVDDLAGGAERLAGAEFFEDVVHLGEGEVGVGFLAALAVSVELFAEAAEALALGFGGVGEWEGLEAASL